MPKKDTSYKVMAIYKHDNVAAESTTSYFATEANAVAYITKRTDGTAVYDKSSATYTGKSIYAGKSYDATFVIREINVSMRELKNKGYL